MYQLFHISICKEYFESILITNYLNINLNELEILFFIKKKHLIISVCF